LLIIWGLRVFFRTISEGVFHCRNCGGDRQYRLRSGRRWFTVFFIPVIPLNKVGEHVQCQTCKTRYVVDVLKLPTAAEMQAALPVGMRAAATAMLQSGDPANTAARQRAVAVIQGAGAQDYADANLDADRAQPAEAIRQALNQVARQLTPDAREWFLAEVIRVGAADGPLTEPERNTAQAVAADLGMTQAQAIGVITLAERTVQD
jgi:zinc-ribbon family/Tellurite resistance protein TerB